MTDPWQSPFANPNVPEPPQGGLGIPWENEQNARTMFETVKAVMLEPDKTFAGASTTVAFTPSFVYAMILATAGGLIASAWQFATISQGMQFLDKIPEEYRGVLEAFTQPSVATFILVPIQVVAGIFIGAGILHVCLLIVGGANGRFEDSIRAVAFAQGSVAVLQIIPFMGAGIAAIWGLVIEIYAVKALHKTTGTKAALGVLLPIGVLLLCCCCGVIAAAGSLGAVLGNQ